MLEFLSEGRYARPGRTVFSFQIRTQKAIPDPGLLDQQITLDRRHCTVKAVWRGPGKRPDGVYLTPLESAWIEVKFTDHAEGIRRSMLNNIQAKKKSMEAQNGSTNL